MSNTVEYRKRKYVSVSTLVTFARCPRRYFYDKCGLRLPGVALAPEFGKAMHPALSVAHLTGDLDLAMDAFLSGGWEEIEEDHAEAIALDKNQVHNRQQARKMLGHYIHERCNGKSIFTPLNADFEGMIEVDDKTSDIEVPWALDVGCEVPLVGRFDGICRHRDRDELWILEYKTASRLGQNFSDAHEMYPQNLVYMLAGTTALGLDLKGVMVEGILKDPKKLEVSTTVIPVLHHHVKDILLWVQYTTDQLLACEERFYNALENNEPNPERAFLKDFTGCTPYPHFYMPFGFRCEYSDLCRVPDFRTVADIYKIAPDHDFLRSTTDTAA